MMLDETDDFAMYKWPENEKHNKDIIYNGLHPECNT